MIPLISLKQDWLSKALDKTTEPIILLLISVYSQDVSTSNGSEKTFPNGELEEEV